MDRSSRGRAAECVALHYLVDRGLTLVERNYRCRVGELDLIMRDGPELVFVEVRYRRASGFGGAAGSVDEGKRRRVTMAAEHYLQRQHRTPRCRFDVVALAGPPSRATVDWIRDAW